MRVALSGVEVSVGDGASEDGDVGQGDGVLGAKAHDEDVDGD